MSTSGVAQAAGRMQESASRVSREVDLWSFVLWSAAVLVPAMALPAANWTDDLGFVPMIAAAGLVLGAVLVLSRFRGMGAFVLAAGYGLVLILWQLTAALDPGMAWRERVFDLAARVGSYAAVVLAGEPSHDSLMFVLEMSLVFWAIAVFGTWWLFRRGGLWLAVLLPGLAVFLNVYYYRYGTRLQIYLPVFLLAALALVVRTELNGRRHGWAQRRAQVSPDVSSRVTQAGIAAAVLLVVVAWMGPQVPDTQQETAAGVTGSRSPFGDFLSDALAGLRAPVNLYGENFASTLALGAGRPPGARVAFQARSLGEVPQGARVYWRARAYDTYRNGEWEVTIGDTTAFRPRQGDVDEAAHAGRVDLEFAVSSFLPAMKLLYLPAEISWVNRSVDLREVTAEGAVVDVLEATSADTLLPGDSYRVRSRLAAPMAGDLRQAGTAYPAWVENAYLQLPGDLPVRVERLAREIALQGATPYDQAVAITTWLRTNMAYERESAAPPEGRDPVDWFLFDSRRGFCDYYASAAVLMLRSLGVPSRLAAGFAQGTYDAETGQYLVSEADLHSWPEVYFPGTGWVEFEPTVSQPPLERAQGRSSTEGGAAGVGESAAATAAASAGGVTDNGLGRLDAVEEVQIPETAVPPTPWLGYLLLGLAVAALVVYVTPARRVVAGWAVAGTRRAGRRTPWIVEEWAAQPMSEAATAFRRLAPWPARLGIRLAGDATPNERAQAVAALIPDEGPTIAAIAEAYNAERYGGRPAVKGEASRAWRSLRPRLYRAGLGRLVNSVFAAGPD
jgi:hypothetical protein